MIGLAAQLPAYRSLAGLQLKTTFAYRSSLVGGIVIVLLRIALLTAVWNAAYGGRPAVNGIKLSDVLTFVTLGNLQLALMRPMLVWYVQQRIHEG